MGSGASRRSRTSVVGNGGRTSVVDCVRRRSRQHDGVHEPMSGLSCGVLIGSNRIGIHHCDGVHLSYQQDPTRVQTASMEDRKAKAGKPTEAVLILEPPAAGDTDNVG